MTMFDPVLTTPVVLRAGAPLNDAQLAAVAFLARYRGRTLESYALSPPVLSVGQRRGPATARRYAGPHRAVPIIDGRMRTRRRDG
jgi:hypothetical protein